MWLSAHSNFQGVPHPYRLGRLHQSLSLAPEPCRFSPANERPFSPHRQPARNAGLRTRGRPPATAGLAFGARGGGGAKPWDAPLALAATRGKARHLSELQIPVSAHVPGRNAAATGSGDGARGSICGGLDDLAHSPVAAGDPRPPGIRANPPVFRGRRRLEALPTLDASGAVVRSIPGVPPGNDSGLGSGWRRTR